MAVLHLLALSGWNVRAVTVDHRLRAEAADEAAFVAEVCARLGVHHDTLVWEHEEITGNLMDQARRARYRLMADWARHAGIAKVTLGHTADDQAETFLMALGRGTGLDGLVGMRVSFMREGVEFIRPFLVVTRAELREFLAARNVGWVDDPTNADDRYTRIKARNALQVLEPLGISAERLGETMRNLRMVQEVINSALSDAVQRSCGIGCLHWPCDGYLGSSIRRGHMGLRTLNWQSKQAKTGRYPRVWCRSRRMKSAFCANPRRWRAWNAQPTNHGTIAGTCPAPTPLT
jgi:tRNA(Ile)-lysidine synthase